MENLTHNGCYCDVVEVIELSDKTQLNKLLQEGWVLITTFTMNAGLGLPGDNFMNYVVGRKREK